MRMTSRERITAAFQHRDVDRTPVFEYVLLSPLATHFLGRPYTYDAFDWGRVRSQEEWRAAVRQLACDYLDIAEKLGHDLIYAVPNPGAPRPAGPAASTSAPVPEPDDPVERVRRRNAARAAAATAVPEETLLVYVELKAEMARRGLDLPILAPAYAHGIWTDVDLMQAMLLDPAVAHEHFRLCTRASLARVEAYAALGLELIGVGGDFAGNRPLISPAAYREFIVPEVREVSRRVHQGGGWAVNASDGNLWSVLEDFLVGCEVDAYLEIDLHAGMDLRRLKATYGDRTTLVGNLDCGNTLSFGTEAAVRQHVRNCLEAGWGKGGHVLCASNAITASVPLANYLIVINTYREFFGLPRFR